MINFFLNKTRNSPVLLGVVLSLIAKLWMKYKHPRPDTITRVCRFKPYHIFPHVQRKVPTISILGKKLKLYSRYLLTFKHKGTTCVACGMEGKWVYLEHHVAMDQPGVYHLKLYGENENGVEVQFTMDHIIPRGKGGKDSLRNIQPMCFDCNQHKGNKLIYVPKKRIKRHVIAST